MQCRVEVLPVPLAWYRIQDKSLPNVQAEYLDQVQALTPYAQAMPTLLQDLPKAMFTMGLHYQRMCERLGDNPIHTILQRHSQNRKSGGDPASVFADEGALLQAVNQMPARSREKLALVLDGWLEYSSARSQLPPRVSSGSRTSRGSWSEGIITVTPTAWGAR